MIWEVFIIVTSNQKELSDQLLLTDEESEHSDADEIRAGVVPNLQQVSYRYSNV